MSSHNTTLLLRITFTTGPAMLPAFVQRGGSNVSRFVSTGITADKKWLELGQSSQTIYACLDTDREC